MRASRFSVGADRGQNLLQAQGLMIPKSCERSPLSPEIFGRHPGRTDSLEPCVLARPGATCGGT